MGQNSGQESFANAVGWIFAIVGFFTCYSDTNEFGTAIVVAIIAGVVGYLIGQIVWLAIILALVVGWFIIRQAACETVRDVVVTELRANDSNNEEYVASYTSSTSNTIEVNLQNKCNEKIFVAVNYRDDSGDWITEGWWSVDPYSTTKTNIETTNSNLYFYADSNEGTEWSGVGKSGAITKRVSSDAFESRNNNGVYVWDKNVRNETFFHRVVNGYGVYTQSFSCN